MRALTHFGSLGCAYQPVPAKAAYKRSGTAAPRLAAAILGDFLVGRINEVSRALADTRNHRSAARDVIEDFHYCAHFVSNPNNYCVENSITSVDENFAKRRLFRWLLLVVCARPIQLHPVLAADSTGIESVLHIPCAKTVSMIAENGLKCSTASLV